MPCSGSNGVISMGTISMGLGIRRTVAAPGSGWCAALALAVLVVGMTVAAPLWSAPAPEHNGVRAEPIAIGPEAGRLIVGFRATPANVVVQSIAHRGNTRRISFAQARTTAVDVASLAQRSHLSMSGSRQLTPSMHVVYLTKRLYGSDVAAALAALRADPAVKFADIDQRRYPHAVPDDPLFMASTNASGQWYMMTPDTSTATSDAAATDAVSAWALTQGSTGTVIADVDTGVRFEHPDLQRAGFGGRLLPGYDFISEDENPTTGAALGTYLIANDGDGWDPDPSDPGDWIDSADQANTTLFPAKTCPIADSSWHGTRVMGILGALTNNGVGIAGMTWNPYLLPVRALGKCGGYDSDIITGMQWAAGMSVTGVPDNPFPADIINLSLGGSGECPSDYADVVATLSDAGVMLVASAGNQSGPVDAPANCSGVLAVAGLRNVGTKVGYSSLGSQIGIAAPAGNCVNSSGPCLKSIDTTSNTGTTVPEDSTYTNQINPNLGTSFSAPIVTGITALMLAVNGNLTPAQITARIKSSATAFPQPAGLPVCPAVAAGSGECACPNDGTQCGAGMVNARNAVASAQRPIAAIAVTPAAGTATLDAGGSTAACGRTIGAYAWQAGPGVSIAGSLNSRSIMVSPSGTAGSLELTVTDSAGATDTAIVSVAADGTVTTAATTPSMAGTAAGACSASRTVTPIAPTVTAAFSPVSVGENVASSLTLTLANSNGFDLTQSNMSLAVPAHLTLPMAATTTCTGAGSTLTQTATTVVLSAANIPAQGNCTITVPLESATAGSYTASVAANALTTGPGGANAAAATATLTVTAPSSGGGSVDWWDTLFVIGLILAGRRGLKRR